MLSTIICTCCIWNFSLYEAYLPAEPTEGAKVVKENRNNKTTAVIINPFRLSANNLMEIADYNIQLWMNLKDNIRKHGVVSAKTFNTDAAK